MSIALADGNVLIALTAPDHVHHLPARAWLAQHDGQLATCPITQGTLLRFLLREGISPHDALNALARIQNRPDHVFWADEIAYDDAVLRGVIGHRQVTDAYLAALAAHFGGRVVTLDRAFAAVHLQAAVLIDA